MVAAAPSARGCGRGPVALGRLGEDRATAWYEAAGYEILERNWRTRLGEVDLVCRKAGLLVFCEVKARSSDQFGSPLEAVGTRKRQRLRRLAALYVARAPGAARTAQVRFDVAVSDAAGRLTVVEDAFA